MKPLEHVEFTVKVVVPRLELNAAKDCLHACLMASGSEVSEFEIIIIDSHLMQVERPCPRCATPVHFYQPT